MSTPFRPTANRPVSSLSNIEEEKTLDEIQSLREEVQNLTVMETVVSPGTLNKITGLVAQQYLLKDKGDTFSLYWNKKKNSFMIGSSVVGKDHNDINNNNENYNRTPGLWKLLT